MGPTFDKTPAIAVRSNSGDSKRLKQSLGRREPLFTRRLFARHFPERKLVISDEVNSGLFSYSQRLFYQSPRVSESTVILVRRILRVPCPGEILTRTPDQIR